MIIIILAIRVKSYKYSYNFIMIYYDTISMHESPAIGKVKPQNMFIISKMFDRGYG